MFVSALAHGRPVATGGHATARGSAVAPQSRYSWGFLDDRHDVARAAEALAGGAVIAHGFGQFYALMTRPDFDTVGQMNLWKGRPVDQVGSICTSPLLIPSVFDWTKVPKRFDRTRLLAMMDALMSIGPFGFRGPAAGDIPTHLSSIDGACRTTQVIVPGYRCPSQNLISESLRKAGSRYLYVTSANQSHHKTGAAEEPAHWQAGPLARDFGHVDELCVVQHRSEAQARSMHPEHLPMSTSIISFHRALSNKSQPTVRLERHGSLHVERVAEIVHAHGFSLQVDLEAGSRLPVRQYPNCAPRCH